MHSLHFSCARPPLAAVHAEQPPGGIHYRLGVGATAMAPRPVLHQGGWNSAADMRAIDAGVKSHIYGIHLGSGFPWGNVEPNAAFAGRRGPPHASARRVLPESTALPEATSAVPCLTECWTGWLFESARHAVRGFEPAKEAAEQNKAGGSGWARRVPAPRLLRRFLTVWASRFE